MDHIIHQLVSDTINVVMITFYIRNEEKNLGISLDEKNFKTHRPYLYRCHDIYFAEHV